MGAPKGNQFWKARSSHGRKPIFDNSDQIWNACEQYFKWVDDHPLMEMKAFHSQGVITKTEVPKMRAMTLSGLCLFLDISEDTWSNYRVKDDFIGVCTRAERYIYDQKFSGASADMLNANIIARDLGLVDRKQTKHTGVIGLKDLSDMTDEELEKELAKDE